MFAAAVAAVLMQAAPAAAPPEPAPVVGPRWDRRPSAADVARAYPKAAAKVLLAGVATTTCVVTGEGRLTDCKTVREDPAGADFGAAAVSLMSLFRMEAVDRDGVAVAGRRVQVPVRFTTAPDIRSAPLTLPPRGGAAGQVELHCRYRERRLDNCLAIGSSSPGVEAEARKIAAEMTLPEMPRAQGRIAIPIYFLTAARPPEGADASRIVAPDWRRRPSAADVGRVYPPGALARRVSGMAVTSCEVTREGKLAACETVDENPIGEGFGEAALKLMHLFLLRPMTKDGEPVDGGTIRIPIRFIP